MSGNNLFKPKIDEDAEKLDAALQDAHQTNESQDAINAAAPTLAEELAGPLTNHYTCLPIQRYQIGRFEFQGGYLSLTESDGAEFEALVATQPIQEQSRLRKLPGAPTPANAGVTMVQGIDHTGNTIAAPSAAQQA